MAEQIFLAVDMGASSGRHLAGRFDGRRLALEEIHRFDNGPVAMAARLYWDLPALWTNVVQGLRAAAAKYPGQIRSIGVDTWGCDFALLGRGDVLLGNPYCYRDPRTEGMIERAVAIVSREEIFAQSGLQFMRFNTLFQLLEMRLANSPLLAAAESLLLMPDLFHWLLTGQKTNELTIASTTQFFDPQRGDWATDLFERLQIPTKILGRIVQPGTILGPLLPDVAAATGLADVQVALPGAHDTASAVVAVPAKSDAGKRPDWCYISSGTWSVMGVETPRPVVTDRCRELNFTNEAGVGGTTRLLKNICGLWLLQECRRCWNLAGGVYNWTDFERLSAAAAPLESLIDVDDPSFASPCDMPEAIRAFCRRTGQTPPDRVASMVRCILESMALKYRRVLGWLEELNGGPIKTIHIIGGGAQNRQLSQMTADACNRRVVAGPIEATAIGNIMVQALAAGAVGSIAAAREAIRASFPAEEFLAQNPAPWDAAAARFQSLVPL